MIPAPHPIVVASASARAEISRTPFGIVVRIADGAGNLREVANPGPRPKREPLTQDPLTPGIDNPAAPPLYTPLSFTVGDESLVQYQGGLFGGNLTSGTRQGIRYSARNVIAARPQLRGGIRLIPSTNDPSGRRLVVLVRAEGPGALQVSARADPPVG